MLDTLFCMVYNYDIESRVRFDFAAKTFGANYGRRLLQRIA